jgi:signal transduction histidine kinase
MNASALTDVSLYKLALSLERSPTPFRVSPTIFKSIVETVFDHILTTGQVTSIWLKLPRGDAWQVELHRYLETRSSTAPVYILRSQRDLEMADDRSEEVFADAEVIEPEDNETGTSESVPTSLPPLIEVPIADESHLRREYFILLLSPEFCLLVLAHRPRLGRSPNEQSNFDFQGVIEGYVPTEDYERKQMLFGLCSLDQMTISSVLNGIRQAIALGQTSTEADPEIDALLTNWDQVMAQVAEAKPESIQVGQFLSRQIQRQEQIWRANAHCRKQAEAASMVQLENEELLNQLRLKNEFLRTVGHELRTPLANMKTALSLVNSSSLKAVQRKRYMNLLKQECDRQSLLITSVLDLLQLEDVDDSVEMQPIRLVDVVPSVISTYQSLAQDKNITLSYNIPPELPAISCLSPWLRQIVIHLTHNAIKFTPKGGQVRVRARLQGDYVQIEFRDTGVGIASSDIPKIFNRFYRVRHGVQENTYGVGLGLTIVQQLVLRCGGSVSVVSKVEEGAAFSVLLPIYGHEAHLSSAGRSPE